MATIPCLYWPVSVTAASMIFRLTRNPTGAPGATTTNTTVSTGTYYAHEGAGSLATQVETDFGTVDGVTVAVSVSSSGIVTITVSGIEDVTSARIVWNNSAATAALGTALGFDVSGSDAPTSTGASSATWVGDYQLPRYWTPGVPPRDDEPEDDQEVVVTRTIGGQNAYDRLGAWEGRRVAFEWLAASKVKTDSEVTATTNHAIERLLKDATAPGRFRYWNDRDTLASGYDDYFLDAAVLSQIRPQRFSEAVPLYSITLPMWEFTA